MNPVILFKAASGALSVLDQVWRTAVKPTSARGGYHKQVAPATRGRDSSLSAYV